jgi:hypothetical protein
VNVAERPSLGLRWHALALLLPPAGLVAGIVLAARRDVGPALAVWATSFAGWIAWAFLLALVGHAVLAPA